MDLDLLNLWLHWVSILDVNSFGCGNKSNEGFKWRKENLPVRLEIPQAFPSRRPRVSREVFESSLGWRLKMKWKLWEQMKGLTLGVPYL